MSEIIPEAIRLEQATERLRQEAETFNQIKNHVDRWFRLRLIMGYVAVFVLPSLLTISAYVIINSSSFSKAVVTSASGALFVDGLSFLVAVWKIVLNPGSMSSLGPVTTIGGGTSALASPRRK
jgi:hypothetical protein